MNRFLALILLLMPMFAFPQSTALLDGAGLLNMSSKTNYIKNPNAQKNVSNVTATGDTAIARSTTTPLYNSSEFNITDTNAWGATWSALAFNEGLKNRLCEVQILARSTAADVATLKVFQNSVAVFSQSLTLSTTNPTKYGGTFPCGDLAYASTVELAGAADPGTIEAGAVYLGEPVSVSSGAIVTEWQSYTPSSGWGATASYTGLYRRVGSNLEVSVKVSLTGAPTGNLTAVTIPAGLVIDTAKIAGYVTGTNRVGIGSAVIAGAGNYEISVLVTSTTGLRPLVFKSDGTYVSPDVGINATTPGTFANGDYVYFTASVPIVGWAATDIVTPESSISGQARYTRATAQAMPGDTSYNIVDFNVKDYDINNEVTTGAGWKFTAKTAGYYDVKAKIYLTSDANWSAGERTTLAIYKTPVGGSAAVFSYFEFKAMDATVT